MVILITGASHTGKTLYAQKLLEKYNFPYLSVDHLKMGLIRSGNTELSPLSDNEKLTAYLWPIIREIIKTAIENNQNLIVEGCYVPLDWANDFGKEYLDKIRFLFLVMTEEYIRNHFDDILDNASVIEKRLCDDVSLDEIIEQNRYYSYFGKKYSSDIILISEEYELPVL